MASADATPRAVAYAALLHLGIIGFLALAMLNCTDWETFADAVHLPQALRPVTCVSEVRLEGPVIEATLVGPAAAPPPAARHAPRAVPKPEPQPPQPQPKPPPPASAKVLPSPVPQPKLQDQEKIAQLAEQKAEQEKQAQEEQQKQRMAELARQQEAERILKQLAKVQAESKAQQRRINLEQQKTQQLADLNKAKSETAENVPAAKQAMTGQAGTSSDAYSAALQNAVTRNWLRPDIAIPAGAVCPVEIRQIPGGQVISAKVLPSCPFSAVAKHSVEVAVLRASPLPYKGFEKEFRRDITFNFRVTSSQ